MTATFDRSTQFSIRHTNDRPGLIEVYSPWGGNSLGLATVRHIYEPSGIRRKVVPLHEASLVDVDGNVVGDLVDHALFPAIAVIAERLGLDPLAKPQQIVSRLGIPDFDAASRNRPVPPDLLEIASEGLGLVRYAPGVRPAVLMAQVAAAFSTARILTVAARRRDCRKIFAECVNHEVDAYLVDHRRNLPTPLPRVSITTPEQAIRVDPRQVDLLLVANARHALNARFELDEYRLRSSVRALVSESEDADDPIIPCYRWYCPRRIGLMPIGEHLAPSELHRIRRVFGFREAFIYPTGNALPIYFDRISIRRRPRGDQVNDEVIAARTQIWENTYRNRQIIRRARQEVSAEKRVLVLADAVEHAAVLRQHLEWPIRVSGRLEIQHLPQHVQPALSNASVDSAGPMLISTLTAATTLNMDDYDVVIRCDGGDGIPSCLRQITTSLTGHSLTVIDCFDRFGANGKRLSRQRLREYRRAGWLPVGIPDPVIARANEFVDELLALTRNLSETQSV